MRKAWLALGVILTTVATPAWSDTVTKKVDTGSHTCTHQGQEYKVDDSAESGSDRFFDKNNVFFREISKFGAGSCDIVGVEERKIKVKLEIGSEIEMSVPVKYTFRAYADCTNNLGNIGKRVGTECEFSGKVIENK